jgi:Zn-dependent M28 family amino/carboxypeptidase
MAHKSVVIVEVVFLILLFGCESNLVEKPQNKNILVLNALGSVSKENIYKTIEELQNFKTRFSWEKQEDVANYLFEKFQEYGIPVEFDEYSFRGKKWKNVIATIHGKLNNDPSYMLIAHLDSISKQAEVSAPGADDNASGCGAVLEIARVLKEVPLDATVKMGIFSNEEQGAAGSKHFAKKTREKDFNLKAVINLDIIGYNGPIVKTAYKTSEGSGLIGNIKLRLKTIGKHILKFLYPDGIVLIGGRPPNRGLVETVYTLAQNYSNLKVKSTVGEDCG